MLIFEEALFISVGVISILIGVSIVLKESKRSKKFNKARTKPVQMSKSLDGKSYEVDLDYNPSANDSSPNISLRNKNVPSDEEGNDSAG